MILKSHVKTNFSDAYNASIIIMMECTDCCQVDEFSLYTQALQKFIRVVLFAAVYMFIFYRKCLHLYRHLLPLYLQCRHVIQRKPFTVCSYLGICQVFTQVIIRLVLCYISYITVICVLSVTVCYLYMQP